MTTLTIKTANTYPSPHFATSIETVDGLSFCIVETTEEG